MIHVILTCSLGFYESRSILFHTKQLKLEVPSIYIEILYNIHMFYS